MVMMGLLPAGPDRLLKIHHIDDDGLVAYMMIFFSRCWLMIYRSAGESGRYIDNGRLIGMVLFC